jgi:hypothetical protein
MEATIWSKKIAIMGEKSIPPRGGIKERKTFR